MLFNMAFKLSVLDGLYSDISCIDANKKLTYAMCYL